MKIIVSLIVLLAPFLLSACGTLQMQEQPVEVTVSLSKQTNPKLCGLEAIKMLTQFHGRPLSKMSQKKLTEIAQRENGISGEQLKKILDAEKYFAAIVPGTLDHGVAGIYRQLDLSNPVIVMLGAQEDVFHYIVVTGYYPKAKKLIMLDPKVGKSVADEKWFVEKWKAAHNFTVIAYPKSRGSF